MTDLKQLEFFVIRYVWDVESGRSSNVGVVLFEGGLGGEGFADVKFIDDFAGIPMQDPELEVELLTELETEIRKRLLSLTQDCSKGGVALRQREWMLRTMLDSLSNVLEVTDCKALLGDPETAMDELFRRYCHVPRVALIEGVRTKKLSGVSYIRSCMTNAFRQGGVLKNMKRHDISIYVPKGDRLKVDFCYSVETKYASDGLVLPSDLNGVLRMFKALSLKRQPEAVKGLAYTWAAVREKIAEIEHKEGSLTAVVEDDVRWGSPELNFATHTLQDSGIVMKKISQLPDIVHEVRKDFSM